MIRLRSNVRLRDISGDLGGAVSLPEWMIFPAAGASCKIPACEAARKVDYDLPDAPFLMITQKENPDMCGICGREKGVLK